MIHAQTVSAIFCKQVKDVLKNTEVLILFIIYPVVAFVMTSAMSSTIGQELLFVSIFGVMHCVFAPIVTTATIISEEKEKNTLRTLIMSSVSPVEYLLSIGSFVLICTLVSGSSFILIGGYSGIDAVKLLAFMSIGLETNLKEMAAQVQGGKPLTLYVVGQSFNLVLTLLVAWLLLSGILLPIPNIVALI